jgi:hypothetical protein
MMARRNRYFEGREDGQMFPRGYPNLNSYVQNLRVLIVHGQRNLSGAGWVTYWFLQIHLLCVGWRNSFSAVLLNPNFLLVHRNRYSEEMDDGQKTPHGHPDFNSYVKILRVFLDNRQTNRPTDRQTDGRRN